MWSPTHGENYPKLSPSSIKRILNGETVDNVIVQVLGYKKVPGSGIDRFRLLLNDGETLFPLAILATPLNHLIKEKKLDKFTIIRLEKYACTEVHVDKKVILCLEIESLVPGTTVKVQITSSDSASSLTIPNVPGHSLPGSSKNNVGSTVEAASSSACASHTSYSANKTLNQTIKDNPVPSNSVNLKSNVASPNKSTSTVIFNRLPSNHETAMQASNIFPVSSLTPYLNRWTIKARIIYKTCLVNYNNPRGSGRFFSFYLLDETGEIKAMAFNDQAEFLHDFLKLNQVYYMSSASVRPSQANAVIKNDFEITVNENTRFELADDANGTPMLTFNFMPISQIKPSMKDSYVDVIGICCNVSEVKTILNKTNNREIYKLDIILIDFDHIPITLSLWGSDAVKFKSDAKSVIVIRNAKITDFAGCSLSLSPLSMLFVNLVIPEAFEMRTWFDSLKDNFGLQSINNSYANERQLTWKTFNEILGESDSVEYFTIKATISMVQKQKCIYRACPTENCFKKVTCIENGLYQCDKCNREHDKFNWALVLTLDLGDFSGCQKVVAFREIAESLVGFTAEQLSKLKEDKDTFLSALSDMHFKSYIFNLRSKVEVINETSCLKITVLNTKPVDFVAYTKKLVSDITHFKNFLNMNDL